MCACVWLVFGFRCFHSFIFSRVSVTAIGDSGLKTTPSVFPVSIEQPVAQHLLNSTHTHKQFYFFVFFVGFPRDSQVTQIGRERYVRMDNEYDFRRAP